MNLSSVWVDVTVVVTTVVMAGLLAWAARRVMAAPVGWLRAGVVGLLAMLVGGGIVQAIARQNSTFTALYADGRPSGANLGLLLAVLALVFVGMFVAGLAVLLVLEVLIPTGSVPTPWRMFRDARSRWRQTRRYLQILSVFTRRGIAQGMRSWTRLRRPSAVDQQELAAALREALSAAGVTFVKFGQMLSTRTDLLPAALTDALASLQSDVPPAPWEQIRTVVSGALGGPIEDTFERFDSEPVASASVGQVHVARFLDGRDVVVKVQRPGARRQVEADLEILARIARRAGREEWGAALGIVDLADGFAASLREELDYTVELENTAALRSALGAAESADGGEEPDEPASSGTSGDDASSGEAASVGEAASSAQRSFAAEGAPGDTAVDGTVSDGDTSADDAPPHGAAPTGAPPVDTPAAGDPDRAVAVRIPRVYPRVSGTTMLVMDRLEGTAVGQAGDLLAELSPQRRHAMAVRLLRCALEQLLLVGTFHADLHPGNVLVTSSGDIALLDFGSVGRLADTERLSLGALLLAVEADDSVAATRALLGLLDAPDGLNQRALERSVGQVVARFRAAGVAGLSGSMFTAMFRLVTDARLAVPGQVAGAFRTLTALEGTLRLIDPGFDIVAEARATAGPLMARLVSPRALARRALAQVAAAAPELERLPGRLADLSADLAAGRLSVTVRTFDDERSRSFVASLARQAVTVVMAAACVLGAIVLLAADAGPVLSGGIRLYSLAGAALALLGTVLGVRVMVFALGPGRR